MTVSTKQTCASRVAEAANRRIESIRLLLCPTEDDCSLVDRGILDTVVTVDGDNEYTYSQEFAAEYREDDGSFSEDGFAEFVSNVWDEIQDGQHELFNEYGLSFDYFAPERAEPYFCYLISTGGPGTEIRFYVDGACRMYRAEFWLLDWFDGAHVNVTSDDTVNAVWDQFEDHARMLRDQYWSEVE